MRFFVALLLRMTWVYSFQWGKRLTIFYSFETHPNDILGQSLVVDQAQVCIGLLLNQGMGLSPVENFQLYENGNPPWVPVTLTTKTTLSGSAVFGRILMPLCPVSTHRWRGDRSGCRWRLSGWWR